MNSPERLVRLFLPLFSTQSGLLTKIFTWMTWNLTVWRVPPIHYFAPFQQSHIIHFSYPSLHSSIEPSHQPWPLHCHSLPISSSHHGFSFSLPGQHLILCSIFPLPKICLHVEYNFTWSCLLTASLCCFLFSITHEMSGLCHFFSPDIFSVLGGIW